MLAFVKGFLTKREGLKEYETKLKAFLADSSLDVDEQRELDTLAEKYGFTKDDLRAAHKRACSLTFSKISSDRRIDADEKAALEVLMQHFGISTTDIKFDQKTFNKFYVMAMVEKGILPEVQAEDLNVVFKKGEVLHWGCPALLRKHKTVTERIRHSGVHTSFRIMKGVYYRTGSVRYSTQKSEYLAVEDQGALWLTNQRIGFEGARKHLALPYKSVLSFDLTSDGLQVTKQGKEVPYILTLDDYEVPATMLSHILNAD